MTSIATSLQTDAGRNLPIPATDSSYINTKSRESSKISNGSASKCNNFTPSLILDEKTINNSTTKPLGSKYRTMSSSPTASSADTSDLFLSASSHLMGYLPQSEAVSRNAQVRANNYYKRNCSNINFILLWKNGQWIICKYMLV